MHAPSLRSRRTPPSACLALALVLASGCSTAPEPARAADAAPVAAATPAWEPWSDAAFARARASGKLVILDLHAVWCHWCHVMEETTYRDPRVVALLAEHYVCVEADQDARPDLSNRYEDYGWPATIVFDAQGRELAKRAGYIAPAEMASLLAAFAADPTPGPSAAAPAPAPARANASAELDAGTLAELERLHTERYDAERGGFGRVHKFIDPASLEYCIARALDGDAEAEHMARQTLDAALALIDPVWGGIYQYSTGGVWTEPHFEKIMSYQADDLRVYALAYAAWKDPRHLRAAQDIRRFLAAFLTSPSGAFYTSQDADLVPGEHSAEYFALDDRARRARGVPRVDTHVYARENGWAIRGLCALHSATGDVDALADALRAARVMLAERALPGGGFRHDASDGGARDGESAARTGANDAPGPYLGDTLALEQAFVALYEATADRAWLEHARAASGFVAERFRLTAGFATSARTGGGVFASALPQRDENIALARVENALFHYTGAPEHRERAEHALRWLAEPSVARKGLPGGVLLAARELANDPVHVTVVGAKHDAAAAALHRAALALPAVARRIEWYDASEGPLANADTAFPELARAAAFACGSGRCSSPAYSTFELAERVRALTRR